MAINPLDKKALIVETKLNESQYSEAELRIKASNLMRVLGGYEIEFKGLSLKDM